LRAGTDPVRTADLATAGADLAGGADGAARTVPVSIAIEVFAASAAALAVGRAEVAAIEATPAGNAHGRPAAATGAIRVAEFSADGGTTHTRAIRADPAAALVQPGDVVLVKAEGAFRDAVGILEVFAGIGTSSLALLLGADAEAGAAVGVVLAGFAQPLPCADTRAFPGAVARLQIERLALAARRAVPVAARALVAIDAARYAVLGPVWNARVVEVARFAPAAVVGGAAAPVDTVMDTGIRRRVAPIDRAGIGGGAFGVVATTARNRLGRAAVGHEITPIRDTDGAIAALIVAETACLLGDGRTRALTGLGVARESARARVVALLVAQFTAGATLALAPLLV
jgi:hypothetical protein